MLQPFDLQLGDRQPFQKGMGFSGSLSIWRGGKDAGLESKCCSLGTPFAVSCLTSIGRCRRSSDMPETNRGRSQDRSKVAGGQKHETSYEAKKTDASPGEVRQAVKKVGNSRTKVEAELKK
jgi:hypothetical protein